METDTIDLVANISPIILNYYNKSAMNSLTGKHYTRMNAHSY